MSEQFFELEPAAVHKLEAVGESVQCFEAEPAAVESKSELAAESVLHYDLEPGVASRPGFAAVPGQELAFVSAYRHEEVGLSVQYSAQRLVVVPGTANRPAVAEGPEVEERHLWAVAVSKAGEPSK